MSSVSLTGADAIQLDGRVLADLAEGDCVVLTFPNDLATVKASKNGNTIYGFNETGRQVDLTLRLLAGSADDKYLNSRLAEQRSDFSSFALVTGSFTKRVGDGAGVISSAVYECSGGIFKKQIDAKSSAEGDAEQSVAVYSISFGNGRRSIQ